MLQDTDQHDGGGDDEPREPSRKRRSRDPEEPGEDKGPTRNVRAKTGPTSQDKNAQGEAVEDVDGLVREDFSAQLMTAVMCEARRGGAFKP